MGVYGDSCIDRDLFNPRLFGYVSVGAGFVSKPRCAGFLSFSRLASFIFSTI